MMNSPANALTNPPAATTKDCCPPRNPPTVELNGVIESPRETKPVKAEILIFSSREVFILLVLFLPPQSLHVLVEFGDNLHLEKIYF